MMPQTLINFTVMSAICAITGLAGLGTGDFLLPPKGETRNAGLEVNEITIAQDGAITYDRKALIEGAHYAWSGQVFKENGEEHCSGGGTWRYFKSGTIADKDVDWLVGDDCLAGLEVGMTFIFNWVSVDGSLADLHYPENGLGEVREVTRDGG